ncbi:MAG: adenylate/guanylate cyclase domain-containing protein [Clostridiales bacterium]|nr:adenylate/guanylate cyclase domain-containing protein [Clostridiales bacterium]
MNMLSGLDFFARDLLYSRRRPTNSAIKIIGIDERTIKTLGPFGTWDRSIYAQLIGILNADKDNRPAVIAFDVLFTGMMGGPGDEDLMQAALQYDNVVSASHLVISEQASFSQGQWSVEESLSAVELPYWLTDDDESVGFSNAVLQPDGLVRWAMIRYPHQGKEFRSLAYQTYLRYYASLGQAHPSPDRLKDAFLIDYAGDTGDFEGISLDLVLGGRIDPIVFKDCVALIGAYTTGLQDNFFTGTNRKAPLYGVEIHANILQNLMEGRQVIPASPLPLACFTALVAMLFYLLSLRKKFLLTTLVALGIIGGYLLAAKMLFIRGWAMPLVYLPLFILLVYAYQYLKLYFAERMHRTRLSSAFRKYVAPQVVDQMARDQQFEPQLGGELRNVAVLFIDIRGFTPLSESLSPQDVVCILNEYFALVTQVIFDHGGTLDKFIGDAVMAVFNAPVDLEDYEYQAVCTALDIVAGAADLEQKLLRMYQKDVGFGIGVNCGEAVVGNIGCGFRMDYTAIGDTINTAARLESNAKRGQILIPQCLYRIVEDRIIAEEIGIIPLKGKSQEVLVYDVKGRKQGSHE